MPRKNRHKFHFIYKTSNLLNNKFYIGMHSTENIEDGYIGSGTILWHAIKKYGKSNFITEIIEYLPNREDLKDREKEIINEDLLKDPNCMNIQKGGGGWFQLTSEEKRKQQIKASTAGGKRFSEKMKSDNEYADIFRSNVGKMNTLIKRGFLSKPADWTGRTHSEKSKKKIGAANSISQRGLNNSQYGTCWITNNLENKKIRKGDYIPDGWTLGRKIKSIP